MMDIQITRILMTTDTVGGVWTYCMELAEALTCRGVEVHLATMGSPLTERQRHEVSAVGPSLILHESRYKLEWMQDPWSDVAAAGEWLFQLADEWQPDVIHLNGYAHGSLPWQAPVLMTAHSCVYSWFAAVRGESPPEDEWKTYHTKVRSGLRRADAVTAPTRAMLTELKNHYGAFQTAGFIPNCRRPWLFHPATTKQPFILSVGRLWDDAKNIAALDAIASTLPWAVRIAGEEDHPDGGSNSFPAVECLGWLTSEEIADWMSRASIYALPARYEPFGLSALEAALSGCALVLGDIPSLREVWDDAAIYVQPDDHDQLRTELCRLIASPPLRREMAARARARAELYRPRRTVERYLRLYELLIASHHALRSEGWHPSPNMSASTRG